MTGASATCRLCGGKGWISVASHLCRGDDLACHRKCPDEHAVPCDACAPIAQGKRASESGVVPPVSAHRRVATPPLTPLFADHLDKLDDGWRQLATDLRGLIDAWSTAERSPREGVTIRVAQVVSVTTPARADA